MKSEGSTALLTGAIRGFGRQLAEQLGDLRAAVYAAARSPDTVGYAGVTAIALDVSVASIAATVGATGDVTLLINNVGSETGASPLTGLLAQVRLEIDTDSFEALNVVRAFAPQLAASRDSFGLNVLSALSWFSYPAVGATAP